MQVSPLNRLPRWSHFLIAVVLSVCVLWFRSAIGHRLDGGAPFLFASLAVTISAFIGGLWPGLLTTLLTTAGGLILFILIPNQQVVNEPQRISIGANLTVCIGISFICGALRSSESNAARSARQARQATDRLKSLINSITDALVTFSVDLKVINFNDAAARLWGLSEKHVGASMEETLPAEVCEAIREPAKTALSLGIASSMEIAAPSLKKTFDVRSFPGGEGLLVYFRDVTARVASDAAIENLVVDQRQTNALLDSLLTHAPLGFAFFSKDYRFERINGVLADINGIPAADHIGKTIRELIPANAAAIESIIDKVFRTGKAVSQLEITGETPKEPGVTRHWLTGFYPVTDSEDVVHSVGAFIIEITQRKEVEEQLRESEGRFRNLADNAPMMVWVCNPDGSANWFNRPWLDFRKLSMDDAICEGCFANIHPDDEPWVKEIYAEAKEKNEPFTVEYRTLASDGEYRWLLLKANPIHYGDGRLSNYLMSSIDITERTSMEESLRRSLANERTARSDAEKANRLKDEFLASLSHELRTPLTTMLGWSELLMRPKVREQELSDGLQIIQRSSKLQLQLINDLLDMSRISVGKINLDLEYAELYDSVQSVIDLVQPSATEKGVTLKVPAPPEPVIVRIDSNRFVQIMWNLLSNAIKFTPKGGSVTVEITVQDKVASIAVRDTGVGIEESFLPYVFDRFRQADAGRSRKHGGLGLGLAIAKQLANLHEGNIEVASDGVNQGCCFKLTLPIADMKMPIENDHEGNEPTSEDMPRQLMDICILLVEDDESSRDIFKRILELEGAVVIPAESAPAARKLMRETSPDVLVSDIGLPDEDGYQLIRSIRSASSMDYNAIPAIALTAFAGSDDRMRAFEAGFNLFLSKPVEPEDLIRSVLDVRTREI